MTIRDTITLILLWVSVLSWSIWIGGTIYQMLVIVPIWSAALPESLRAFFTGTNFNRTILRFFGPRWMPVRVLPVLGLLFFGWNLPGHRPLFIAAAACVTIGVAFTLAYLYPLNRILFDQAGANHTAEEIRALVRRWITADRVRLLLISVGYLAVRALSIAMPGSGR